MIGQQVLTYEELNTVLIQVECLLNSRPIGLVNQSDPLTPAHFLSLTPLKAFPALDVSDRPLNRLNRYELIQNIVQNFWKRWKSEYLTTLQLRYKWNSQEQPIQVGSVVLLCDENAPPLEWKFAKIVECIFGNDGVCRVVKLRTVSGNELTRPVTKVCPLPSQ